MTLNTWLIATPFNNYLRSAKLACNGLSQSNK